MQRPKRGDRNHRQQDPLAWAPAMLVITLLAMAFAAAATLLPAVTFRPRVGDMIAFLPGSRNRISWHVSVSATRVTSPGEPVQTCILASNVMAMLGGSLVIEAREDAPERRYRLHWAGARTAQSGHDCGANADLLLTMVDLRKLATAAGGFGVAHRRIVP